VKSTISVTDVLRNFADYINRVVYRRERFVLVRGGRPVAELGPVPLGSRLAELPGLLESLPSVPPEDADAWAAELDAARLEVSVQPPRDPWAS
jgi:antitoxin (DNA-binding transcriptional repressor) of toxin-antitoxin stability system